MEPTKEVQQLHQKAEVYGVQQTEIVTQLLLDFLIIILYKPTEISDKEKEKLIYQMAYRCDPPEMSNLEDMLQKRRAKKIDIEITPRTRQGECKLNSTINTNSVFSTTFLSSSRYSETRNR